MHESGSFVSRLSAEANAAAAASNAGPDDIHLDVHGASAYGLAHHQIARMHQPVKIIHKDHDAVTAFCINKVPKESKPLQYQPLIFI